MTHAQAVEFGSGVLRALEGATIMMVVCFGLLLAFYLWQRKQRP